jgi:putative Mg2+ transporter-C (MgtC) family protein
MLEWNEILIRLLLACLFGGLVGLERERKNWAAGMRTHMIVCLGSSLMMIVSAYGFSDILHSGKVDLDPSRIASQVVSGIGFIGAGTILFTKGANTVRGLTTAAGLWTVAGIGLATGGGMFIAASIATVLSLIILWALQPLEKFYAQRFKMRTIKITTTADADTTDIIQRLENIKGTTFVDFTMKKAEGHFILDLRYEEADISKLKEIITQLQQDVRVKEVYWVQ